MAMPEQMPLAEVKNRLPEVVDVVERECTRIVITNYGRPATVGMNVADLESLEETFGVAGSEALLADIKESAGELAAGATTPGPRMRRFA